MIQERAYTTVAAGKDALIIAPTAGGKSEAALIPVMDDLLKNCRPGITCLYISPLKALINDQEVRFRALCVPLSLSVIKWHGDVAPSERSWKDDEPPNFLMITPESLEVLLQEKTLATDLRQIRYIIIDELHAFVESDRGVHLKVLLDRMDRITKRKIQRIGLSATTGNPEEILHWLSDDRHPAELVAVPAVPGEKKFIFIVESEKRDRINALVRIVSNRKALVFVNSRGSAEDLMNEAAGRIRNLHIHHSSLSPLTRKLAENAFSSHDGACIICTSTLELGIDIGDLDVVVQVGPPNSVSSFLQRMGRSGRRGNSAFMAWVLESPCELLCSVAIIECAREKSVENLEPPKKPYNVLLQQIFLYLHHHSRATRRQLAAAVLSPPVFGSLHGAILDKIISHLIECGYLTTDGEILMLGQEAERHFGRSNWKDLYSVINGGGEYRAMTPDGEVVGKLDARFVNRRSSEKISLGGQTWSLVKCDEGHNIVVVIPGGSASSRTFWTGGSEIGFSPLVCRMVQRIRSRGRSLLPLGDGMQDLLKRAILQIPEGVGPEGLFILENHGGRAGEVLIFSLQGTLFNRLLTLMLRQKLGNGVQVRYNEFVIKVSRAGKQGAGKRTTLAIREIAAMNSDEILADLPLPPAENWKFALALPDPLFRDLTLSDYYHAEDFQATIREINIFPLDGFPPSP